MKNFLILLALIASQMSITETQAQTAKQSADCLMFYQITLNKLDKVLDYNEKRDLRISSKKAAEHLDKKSSNNSQKLIESSGKKIRSQIERARKRSAEAIESYFYKMTRRCDGYNYR